MWFMGMASGEDQILVMGRPTGLARDWPGGRCLGDQALPCPADMNLHMCEHSENNTQKVNFIV